MNPYSTELRRAMTLADQILALKQNRGLVDADAMQVDAGAFFPNISRWTQMCGFRMSGRPKQARPCCKRLRRGGCVPPTRAVPPRRSCSARITAVQPPSTAAASTMQHCSSRFCQSARPDRRRPGSAVATAVRGCSWAPLPLMAWPKHWLRQVWTAATRPSSPCPQRMPTFRPCWKMTAVLPGSLNPARRSPGCAAALPAARWRCRCRMWRRRWMHCRRRSRCWKRPAAPALCRR